MIHALLRRCRCPKPEACDQRYREALLQLFDLYNRAYNRVRLDYFDGKLEHPYYFIGMRYGRFLGSALSVPAYENVFARLKKHLGIHTKQLGSHSLRAMACLNFVDNARAAGRSEEAIRTGMLRRFGWSPYSKMPTLYTERDTKDFVDNINKELIDDDDTSSSNKFETDVAQVVANRQRRKTSAKFEVELASDTWEIAAGRYIHWAVYGHLATPAFIKRLKEDIFAEILSANRLAPSSVANYELALRNCLEFTHDEGADLVDDLTDDIIAAWRPKAAGKQYPWYVKNLVTKARKIDNQYLTHVTKRLLDKIKAPNKYQY